MENCDHDFNVFGLKEEDPIGFFVQCKKCKLIGTLLVPYYQEPDWSKEWLDRCLFIIDSKKINVQ